MQTIVWEVECLCCVKVRRYCKKCGGKNEFVSSGLFRVNANKRTLDVWLVYRCARCGASWNLPVYERVNTRRLSPKEQEGFAQNDAELARRYAMDAALLARHGCETQPPEFTINGPDVPPGRPVLVVMKSAVPLDVPVARLLRQKLGVSAKGLDAQLESSVNRRQKLGREARIIVERRCGDDHDTGCLLGSKHYLGG